MHRPCAAARARVTARGGDNDVRCAARPHAPSVISLPGVSETSPLPCAAASAAPSRPPPALLLSRARHRSRRARIAPAAWFAVSDISSTDVTCAQQQQQRGHAD